MKKYIKALIEGFPKDEEEAKEYGIEWNNGVPVDNNSGVKSECDGRIVEKNGRVIKPLGVIT